MTTIVATREAMASDRRVSGGPMFRATKIRRINESLYGGCGNVSQILKMFEWFENPDQTPTWRDIDLSFAILQLGPKGLFLWESEMIAIPISTPFYSVGSGSYYAMGALEMGATLKQAVRIASKYDPGTGPEVQVHHLHPKPKSKIKTT